VDDCNVMWPPVRGGRITSFRWSEKESWPPPRATN
jgi:hypothetical protein